jgi:hypothetical protein
MLKDQGLVLRSIPYSDSARIYQCFTLNTGLISLFGRVSNKKSATRLQTGAFIVFTARQKPNTSLYSLNEVSWDPSVPTDLPNGQASALWMFTLELMQRSIKEEMAIPALFHRLAAYYAYLTQGEVSLNPIIPLVLVSHDLGVCDSQMVMKLADDAVVDQLLRLGIDASFEPRNKSDLLQSQDIFNVELDRFQQHFNISQFESLYLLDP